MIISMLPLLPAGAAEVKTIFDAKADMSANQGENNWYYRRAALGQFGLNSYTDMGSYQDIGEWYDTGTDFTYGRIRNIPEGENSQSSGSAGDSARVFVAPYSGKLTISFDDNSVTASADTQDVIRFRIYKNDDIIYPNAAVAGITPDTVDTDWLVLGRIKDYYQDSENRKREVDGDIFTADFEPVTIDVEQGDSIIFRVNKGSDTGSDFFDGDDRRSNNNGDKLLYNPVITYTEITDAPTEEPAEADIYSEPVFLTDADGNLANNAVAGEEVVPNICITYAGDYTGSARLTGELIFAVYDAKNRLNAIITRTVELDSERVMYSGDSFKMPRDGLVKAMLWNDLDETISPLAQAQDFPQDYEDDPEKNGEISFPGVFKDLPFTITRTGRRSYTHNATPENQLDWSDATTVYLTSSKTENGANADDLGLTEQEPITAGRWIANHKAGYYTDSQRYILTIVDNFYNWSNAAHSITLGERNNVNNAFKSDVLIRSGSPSGFTWMGSFLQDQVWTEEDGIYKTTLQDSKTVYDLINFEDKDRYGVPKPKYQKVDSAEECRAQVGTFFQDGGTIYCNPADGGDMSGISLILEPVNGIFAANVFGGTYMWQNIGFMLESIYNNTFNGQDYWRGQEESYEALTPTFYFFNCTFARSKDAYTAITFSTAGNNNGRPAYKTYLLDCIAAYANRDGFNYHSALSQGRNTNVRAVEVNCLSYCNGVYPAGGAELSTASNNGSTAHEGMAVLRVGCKYWNNMGSPVADINDCFSISLGCEVYSIADGATGEKYAFWVDNRNVSEPVNNKYIIDCLGTGANLDAGITATSTTYVCDYEGYKKSINAISPGAQSGSPLELNEITWEDIKSGNWAE